MKIDLHCHSKHSKRATLWIMKKLGCPESFTEPLDLYEILKLKGMDAVTITDHNVIDGCLDIAHLPDTFISCEYTAYFPSDRCKVHILAYGITEQQHRDLSELRENIFDLAAYLNRKQIVHVCAHPLFSPNDRLSLEHLEQLVLLFKNWEWNGDQNPYMNAAMQHLVDSLTPAKLYHLAEKHGLRPYGQEPWAKHMTGGSDDHSSLNLGRTYTEVAGANTLPEFWAGLAENRTVVRCNEASPKSFARNIYGIAYQFYKSKFDLEWYVDKDNFLHFLDRVLQTRPEAPASKLSWFYRALSGKRRPSKRSAAKDSLFSVARYEAGRLLRENPELMRSVRFDSGNGVDLDEKWFNFANKLSNTMFMHVGGRLVERFLNARLFDLFDSMASVSALYALLGAHFVSYSHYAHERQISLRLVQEFTGSPPPRAALPAKVAHFSDTLYEDNQVARTLRNHMAAARKLGKDYTVVTCMEQDAPQDQGLAAFAPVGTYDLPEYPDVKLLAPPFLEMLDYCYAQGFTHIHVSTPGPVGVAALFIARILRLPISGSYQTALPQFGRMLTDDTYVEDMLWKGIVWFYDQMDEVLAPSRAIEEELVTRGIHPDKVAHCPRSVDIELFHPRHQNGVWQKDFGVHDGHARILYVGRMAREKNLDTLAEAFGQLVEDGSKVHLLMVGEGPYAGELEQRMAGLPVTFSGRMGVEELARVYASADFLVFTGAAGAAGDVVLEAQASGIPVIVTDEGGPQEEVLPGETGLVVPARDAESLKHAMEHLSADALRRRNMGFAARAHMTSRDTHRVFERLWARYTAGSESSAPIEEMDPLIGMLPGRRSAAL